jgi:hypothetical protein
MGRPSRIPEPEHTLDDACAAVERIRRIRADAGDPDLRFYPTHPVDDDDVDDAHTYLRRYRRVPPEVQRAELPDRALLLSYRRRRDTQRSERDLLDLLNLAHRIGAWPTQFGPPIGLTRQNAWMTRRALSQRHHAGDPAADQDHADRLTSWLTEHRGELLAIADLLVDHGDHLTSLLPDHDANELAEAISVVGMAMSTRPTNGYAAAICYAMWLLRPDGPARPSPDTVVRDGILAGQHLREEFNDLINVQPV